LAVIANSIPVSGNETIISVLINVIRNRDEYPFIEQIGDIIIESDDLDTKTVGVKTLGELDSDLSLDQLIRILQTDHVHLESWEFYDAMQESLAVYNRFEALVIVLAKRVNTRLNETRNLGRRRSFLGGSAG
jgi:hypothetical protein